MHFYDISPEISADLAVFPGDTAFSRDVDLCLEDGDSVLLSHITSTLHLGAHTDAPNHYHAEGVSIEQRALHYYYGPAQVIRVTNRQRHDLVTVDDIAHIEIKAPRVLFHTNSFPNPNQWQDDFAGLCANLVKYLAEKEVMLVGIDTPSIDVCQSKTLDAHQAVMANDMAILEGVVLTEVPEGVFTLIALPLKIKEADASPVRAVLLDKI